jgi:plastocyanin
MRLRLTSTFLFALTFFSFAHSAGAKTWTVQVGGTMTSGGGYGGGYTTAVLTYSPAQVTINVGDSVTFRNLGGAAHNVHADDNSFRCANGCDGVGMGDGTPSSADWTATVTFTKAGTVSYYCDNHKTMGMTGSIVVNATAPPPITINGTTSGAWYNPEQSGQGFLIQTYDPNVFVAIWFVFTPDGNPQWVYGQGTFDSTSNVTTIPAAIYSGAKFPPNYNADDRVQTSWGNLTFTFTDCNTATVSWASTAPGYGTLDANNNYSGNMTLTRLAGISGYACTP